VRASLTITAGVAGLCASCRFAEIITSSRGSTFYLCTLSETNPAFRRYPALPVLRCSGYQPTPGPRDPLDRTGPP
jgi:hypothetical protein